MSKATHAKSKKVSPKPDKISNILELVQHASRLGNLIPGDHAQAQMRLRNIDFSDIEEAIDKGYWEKRKDEFNKQKKVWKYAIRGLNKNRDKDLRIIIEYENPATIIITVIDKYKPED